MDTSVFLIVILAAVLHATWNAIVKTRGEKVAAMAAVAAGEAALALLIVPFVPIPPMESWPYLAGGVVLHVGYKAFLAFSYRVGDLTQVYPLARGSAPLIVAALSALVVGEELTPGGTVAVAVIGFGIISLGLTRRAEGKWKAAPTALALATGCFIAGYTMVDGLGARIAGDPHGFWAWLALIDGLVFIALAAVIRRAPPLSLIRGNLGSGLAGGAASFCAYWLVVWALTLAPMAHVAALRETSIVFAFLIGMVFLKEKPGIRRLFATAMVLGGVILLRFSR